MSHYGKKQFDVNTDVDSNDDEEVVEGSVMDCINQFVGNE
jgi:hypothetical protein